MDIRITGGGRPAPGQPPNNHLPTSAHVLATPEDIVRPSHPPYDKQAKARSKNQLPPVVVVEWPEKTMRRIALLLDQALEEPAKNEVRPCKNSQ